MAFRFLLISSCTLLSISCVSTKKELVKNGTVTTVQRAPSEVPKRVYNLYGYQVPLHNSETVPKSEEAAIESLNEIMLNLFKGEYSSGKPVTDPATGMEFKGTRRGVHPRAHGCVAAEFRVRSDLKNEVGIFKKGSVYPATIRFSNGSPKVAGDDRSVDTRGFAMKVHNVDGRPLLGEGTLMPGEAMSQDFTLNSTVPFFSDTAERYSQFMQILTSESNNLEDAGKKFLLQLVKGYPRPVIDSHPLLAKRIAGAFIAIQKHKATTPLGINYFSITPFQHGPGDDADVVKYKVEPCNGPFNDPVKADDKFFLRTNLKSRIESKGACFKFMLQTRPRPDWTVEDPTLVWSEKYAPFSEIARIHIPRQQLMDEMTCEKIVINPWNTIADHKPLGGINRIRLPTYLLSVERRQKTNGY